MRRSRQGSVPTRRGARGLCLLALLLALPACGEDLENGAFLERPRVLGARIEVADDPARAWPAPDETVDLRWLVASPDDTSWSGAFAACIAEPNQTGVPGCAGEPFAVAQTGAPTLDPVVQLTLPGAEAFEGTTGELLVLGVLCAGGMPTLERDCGEDARVTETVLFGVRVALGDATNDHPTISDETFTVDGEPWDPPPDPLPESGCASLEPTAALPRVAWRDGEEDPIRVGVTTQPDDREEYLELVFGEEEPQRVEAREELTFSHIATFGRFQRLQTVVFDEASMLVDVPYQPPARDDVPADGQTVEMIFVVRDGRGGADWTSRALCLTP